jgi:long-chain acyl-CoA synthetase
MPISGRVAAYGQDRPDALAFAIGEERTSFGELARRAAQVAAGLGTVPPSVSRRLPLPAGGRLLALAVGNCGAFAELFVGGTAGEHACALLDPNWAPAQTAEILPRLSPDLLVIDPSRAALVELARRHGIPFLTLGPGIEGGEAYEDWLARHAGADPDRFLAPGPDEATFLVGFTSGTTSVPKAFHRSRASWRASLAAGRSVFGLSGLSRTLAPGPLAHGLTHYALAEALDAGAAFHGLPRFDAEAFASTLLEEDIRRVVLVPTMLAKLCTLASARHLVFPALTSVVSAGSKIDARLVESAREILPNAGIVEYYGASELGFVSVARRAAGSRHGDVGHAFPGVEISVREADGQPAGQGRPGTVAVRSPLVCDGYLWGSDGKGFRTDGTWASVGDIGWLDPEGALHLVGREGGMVITGGLNVYPTEVEDALRRVDGIEEAVVLGMPDEYLGRRLVAIVCGVEAGRMSQDKLMNLCAVLLPRYKIPRQFFMIDSWPLTQSGKIARRELEDWISNGSERLVPLPASG